MREDLTSGEQMQHANSESTTRDFPVVPTPRRKKFLSKEERNYHAKQSVNGVLTTHLCNDKVLDQPAQLKYLEVKRDVLKIKQELLNQSLVINYAVSSRPILNDSISKSVTLKSDQKTQPIHMNLNKNANAKHRNDDDVVSCVTSDDSIVDIHTKKSLNKSTCSKKNTIIKHDENQRDIEKNSNKKCRREKRTKSPLSEHTENNDVQKVYNVRSNKNIKQRIASPKHKKSACAGNPTNLCSDDAYLNEYNKKIINEGNSAFRHRTKSEDLQKRQMHTWVYDVICCQNYYSVALYLGLLILIVGIIFVAFKLYLTFILPRDKETHSTQHANQQHWDNPNLINPLGLDYDKVANQLHGFRSDYNSLQNLSNIQPSVDKHNNPTPLRRRTGRKTLKTFAINTPSKKQQRLTDLLVKKDVVPTVTTSTSHTWNKYASQHTTRKVSPPTKHAVGNNNRFHMFKNDFVTTTIRPLILTTPIPHYYPYAYNQNNQQQTDNTVAADWQWNGFNWVKTSGNTQQQYVGPNENDIGIQNEPYSETIRTKEYANSINFVTTPSPNKFPSYYPTKRYTAHAPQTTSTYQRYQKWWQQYYSALSQMNGNTQYNQPTTSPKYSATRQPRYNAYLNGYQTTRWPVIDKNGYNTYANGYQSANGYIDSQGYYNSFPNIYRTTSRSINNKDVTMLMNYHNQLESNLGAYINQVQSEASGYSSGDGVETNQQHKHNQKKKWKKKKKKKRTTTTTTKPTTTTTVTPTTTANTTPTTTITTTKTTTTTPTTVTTTTATLSTTTVTPPVTTTTPTRTPGRTTARKLVTFTNSFTNTINVPSKPSHRNTKNRDSHNRFGMNEDYKPDLQNEEEKYIGEDIVHNNNMKRNSFRNRYDDDDGWAQLRDKVHLADYNSNHFGGENVEISNFGSDGDDNPSSVSRKDHIGHVYGDEFSRKHDDKKHYMKDRYYDQGGENANKYNSYATNPGNSDNTDGDAKLNDDEDNEKGDDDDDNEEHHDSHNDADDDNSVGDGDNENDDTDGDQDKVRGKSQKITKHLHKHKIQENPLLLDADDEPKDDEYNLHSSRKYKFHSYLSSQKLSKKHKKHKKRKSTTSASSASKSAKPSADHRLRLLATIQRRIEALKKMQKHNQSNKIKDDKFLEEVGHKQSEVKHVKKSCALIKTFQPGTIVRIAKGPERRHGKVIYSIRACRKVLVENDLRIKCKDIEYKISGGRLTVRVERRGRIRKFSIFACRHHHSSENSGSGEW